MLFELHGLATIKNVQTVSPTFIKLNISFKDTEVNGEKEYKSFGNRWVNLTKAQSEQIVTETAEDGGPEALVGCLVEITASAETIKSDNGYFENYRANYLQILGGQDAADAVDNQPVFLRGTGNIRKVSKITENLVKLLVISSEKTSRENEVTGNRWVTISGNYAKWIISEGDRLIGQSLQFKAKATTDSKGEGSEKTYFENYKSVKSRILWTKKQSESA